MVFALQTGRFVSVVIALLLLFILLGAFVRYTRKASTDDDLRRAAERGGRDAKVCPDCASAVSLDAGVCQHCGYKFA
jgi:ribosomal protein L40E